MYCFFLKSEEEELLKDTQGTLIHFAAKASLFLPHICKCSGTQMTVLGAASVTTMKHQSLFEQ